MLQLLQSSRNGALDYFLRTDLMFPPASVHCKILWIVNLSRIFFLFYVHHQYSNTSSHMELAQSLKSLVTVQ